MKNGVSLEDRSLAIVANLVSAFEFYAVVSFLHPLEDIFSGASHEIYVGDDGAAQARPE